jgi:hypothetical protein
LNVEPQYIAFHIWLVGGNVNPPLVLTGPARSPNGPEIVGEAHNPSLLLLLLLLPLLLFTCVPIAKS